MYLNESIRSCRDRYIKRAADLEKKMEGLPEGVLGIHKSRDYYIWRVTMPDGTRKTIVKEDEALFAVDLTTLRISYQYEKILIVNGIEIAADFTTLDIRTFQEIPIELFGMMDDPEYRQMYKRKMKTYFDAGYIPGVNMLTFYETSAAPLNHVQVQEDLENFFFKRPPVML